MATKAIQQSLSDMVPNGTSTSRTYVGDVSSTSDLKSNAAPLQSLETASEKDLNGMYVSLKRRHADYLLIFEIDHHYVVLNEDAICLFSLGLTAQVADCMVFEDYKLYALLDDLMTAGKKAALVSPLNA